MPAAAQDHPIETIARLLGISPRRIRQLTAAGVIPRSSRGRYPLVGSIQGYVRLLRDRALGGDVGDSARERLRRARAELAEHELAARRAEVVEVAVAEAAIGRTFAILRAKMEAVPERYGAVACPEHPARGRRALERVVAELLAELEAFELGEPPAAPPLADADPAEQGRLQRQVRIAVVADDGVAVAVLVEQERVAPFALAVDADETALLLGPSDQSTVDRAAVVADAHAGHDGPAGFD
jgi:hypothetical protein